MFLVSVTDSNQAVAVAVEEHGDGRGMTVHLACNTSDLAAQKKGLESTRSMTITVTTPAGLPEDFQLTVADQASA